ncbi:DsbE family thiol:disulfide interchange protein [Pseudothauera lacus]|uniref:DsbE family thiol:disulfide interchange protein n=1 Tax=Pseudothauera lacus TaxID=2136175 RepID=A0A2T4IBA3_9RHOO|nr:DsbE family thiol:disulfide interchange protein [Pseudothauera lacus]PTD95064.1 DsbE family thiol:disulfide interchange protein [Pseudothauera lacus]
MKAKFLVPLVIFLALAGFLAYGLKLNPREVPSPLVGKPAPAFSVAQLQAPEASFSSADMRGQVWLLNVWASWCVSCRQEHPLLVELGRRGVVPVVGLNYKDGRADALDYLVRHGNPYTTIAVDPEGKVGFDYGVYGTPETFLIDREGVIRYKHIGPLTREHFERVLMPMITELSRAG